MRPSLQHDESAVGVRTITPAPADDEVVAIVAAIQVAYPRSVGADERITAPRWRFSGRWWTKPAPLRRRRPWGL
ncbi:MAG: hypothetical protein WAX12_14075 [Candidatus Microthrix subdominans]|uniref:Uncharacterized protein n=1 Tax=Candidatus Neomicrothrix subdominans TaxID=2954438 RepID=A0A936NDW7_9ACTN|nr:hypothetical protein [Candidatus Microthrix sp.]MBK9297079.1 hypothetical protein [Candidatus Microthrix subdominans]MBK6309093.1 hypothetical protein [Candidatus Microthrix sp.]MBK6440150.1 hypothetical protein [Candidatus Microthrix sp.]MBK6970475.1 hypothetical protein [Candidatus Microthrix sp.]MBK7163951.1 hypothetical protein [Candidatus Microthrix sp.]